MISPESLRRHTFFSFLDHDQLHEVAMITDRVRAAEGDTLFEGGDEATALYFLVNGEIELHYVVRDAHLPQLVKDFLVGHINPGEVLGFSTLIAPNVMTATARVASNSELLEIDGERLRGLTEKDHNLAYGFLCAVAQAAVERLHTTRILLAAASGVQATEAPVV